MIPLPKDDGVSSTDIDGFVANRPYSLAVSAGTPAAPGTLTLTSNIGLVPNCFGLSLTSVPAITTVSGMITGNPSAPVTAPAILACMSGRQAYSFAQR